VTHWGSIIAGAPADLVLSVRCMMPVLKGENVTIELNGFTVEHQGATVFAAAPEDGVLNLLNFVPVSSSDARAKVIWRQSNMGAPLLILQATADWLPAERRTLKLPSEVGLRLPAAVGVLAEHVGLSSDASLGPIMPSYGWAGQTSLAELTKRIDEDGGLYLSYLGFAEPKAAAQSAMVLVICLGVPLLSGDSLSVMLPGFSLKDQQNASTCTDMSCNSTCVARCVVEEMDMDFLHYLGCIRRCSTVMVQSLRIAQPIVFSDEPLAAAEALARAELGMTDVEAVYRAIHEVVSYKWSNGSASLEVLSSKVHAPTSNVFVASAVAVAGGVHVKIQSVGETEAGQVVALVVPSTLGLVVPQQGFPAGHKFTFSASFEGGLVAARSFQSAPAVGHFYQTRVTYDPAGEKMLNEGQLAVVSVSFALNAQILAGELVRVYLPGFRQVTGHSCTRANTRLSFLAQTLTNTSNITRIPTNDSNLTFGTLDTVFNNFLEASWDADKSFISLTAAHVVPAHQRHSVTVPCEAGMVATNQGLAHNDPRLSIGTNAQAGLVVGESVASSPRLQAVCGIECGGILAGRHQMPVEEESKGLGSAPPLPALCRSISAVVSGECVCGHCASAASEHEQKAL